ncbi:hypothetical protein SDC9_89077 [bioreactor metagenome]|uniref:Uncharacterized protein n=1 Tax=bioreactor metagenome TaxID=1076179 RepID=A0A644ZNJ3_9ZZZZ
MRNKNKSDPEALLQFPQFVLHVRAQLQVQRRQRLIQQQHIRFVDYRSGDCNPLLLATRHFTDFTVFIAFQLDHFQGFFHLSHNLILRHFLDRQSKCNVIENIHVRKQGIVLENCIDFASVRRNVIYSFAIDFDDAFRSVREAGYQTQDCCFSTAGGAQ